LPRQHQDIGRAIVDGSIEGNGELFTVEEVVEIETTNFDMLQT